MSPGEHSLPYANNLEKIVHLKIFNYVFCSLIFNFIKNLFHGFSFKTYAFYMFQLQCW